MFVVNLPSYSRCERIEQRRTRCKSTKLEPAIFPLIYIYIYFL